MNMKRLITNRLEQLINYLEPHLPIATCHMVDFFPCNLFETHLSIQFRSEIQAFGFENVKNSILNTKNLPWNECPKLCEYLTQCRSVSLPNFEDVCLTLEQFQNILIEKGCKNLSGLKLRTLVSSKKSHEVEMLSEISSALNELAKIEYIIDVGDGKGYLSSALALHKGFKVLGIDSSDSNTKSAARRAEKLNKILTNKNEGNVLYKQTTLYVTETTDLNNLLRKQFSDDVHHSEKLGLIGLHTCGNLSPICLKIFNNNPNIKTICNVGCCYHLLDDTGFPLSNYLKTKRYYLPRNMKMLACQSLDRILHEKELPSQILYYRALLQIILLKYCPELIERHVGRFNRKSATFINYVERAFEKFGIEIPIKTNEIIELENCYKKFESTVHIFYLLRAHLAPIIEAIVLLDRLLYLHELNYCNTFLVQLFNPVISPRCYGIVAFKNEN